MSRGPGITGDKNFETSVEFYRKGDDRRAIRYGVTKAQVLEELQAAHGTDLDWEWDWVVIERRCAMGLPPAWARATRGFKAYIRPN